MTNEPTIGADANGSADDRADAVLSTVRKDFEDAERKIAGEIDPGIRAVVIAVLVLLLLGTFSLPHTGGASGWDVLSGDSTAVAESISIASRVFAWMALVFGVVGSMLALVTRRWAVAWGAVAGTSVSCILGMLAIWSRLTPNRNTSSAGPAVGSAGAPAGGQPGSTGTAVHSVDVSGPGIGLILAVVILVLLTFYWIRVVWARSASQLVAAEERRSHADVQEQRVLDQMRRSSASARRLRESSQDGDDAASGGSA